MRAHTVLLCLLVSSVCSAQLWKKTRVEVKPGQGIGPVQLGQPLSKSSQSYLGQPFRSQPPTDEAGSGYSVYGQGDNRDLHKGILLRFHDGKDKANVESIQVKAIRASTREGCYMDCPTSLVTKIYPQAQQDINPFSRNPEFCLPGLTIHTKNGKVEEFLVEPRDRQRWRFCQLKVVPGESVGPFVMGKAVPQEALDLLGPPTLEVKPGRTQGSGLLRWAIAGQSPNRIIEVVLHNGQSPKAVVSVKLRGVQAETDQRVKLGDKAEAVKDLYPDGREGLHESAASITWRIPGASFVLRDGTLKEILVYDLPRGAKNRGR